VPPARESLRALSRQGSEVPEHSTVCVRPAWDMEPEFRDRLTYTHSVAPPQRAPLSRTDSVEYRGPSAGLDTGSDMVPPTPAFPISPPTPYAVPPARESLRALSRQGSEVPEHSTVCVRPAWDMEPEFRDRLTYTHSVAPPQ
ncbi:tensin-3 isoform X1, partial [Tachysurus ichikawai]